MSAGPEFAFIVGWSAEVISTYTRAQLSIESIEEAETPELYLYESMRGDAVYQQPASPSDVKDALVGLGYLVKPRGCTAKELLQSIAETMVQYRNVAVRRKSDQTIVEAIAFTRNFPQSTIPGTLCPNGDWFKRELPTPLVNVSREEMQKICHIFAYGTLRHDDTSGANWTKPFNEGMTSTLATVKGLSMYLMGFPIVLVPPHPTCENEGIVGCIVTSASQELFSQKLCMADRIEGSPRNYRRGVINAITKDGKSVLAFIYFKVPSEVDLVALRRTRIASGNFLRRGGQYDF